MTDNRIVPGVISPSESSEMRRKHVFAVNGSAIFLNLMRELFDDERYNVTTTNYVPRTWAQLAALQPDLLLIDLVYQRQAGWDLLEQIKAEALTSGIPVIVTATDGRLLERAQAEAERYAGNRYFIIPFDLDDLINTVHELIGGAERLSGEGGMDRASPALSPPDS